MPHKCTNCGREFPDGSQEMLSGCPDCGGNKFQFKPAKETGLAPDDERSGSGSAGGSGGGADSTGDREYGEWPETAKRPAEKDGDAGEPSAASGSGDSTADSEPTVSDRSWPTGGATESDTVTESDPTAESGAATQSNPAAQSEPTAEASASGDSDTSAEQAGPTHSDTGADPETASGGAAAANTEESDDQAETPQEDEAQAMARSEMVSTDELPEQEASAGGMADAPTDPSSTDFERLREELNDQFESIRVVSPGTYELNLMELYDRQEYIISLREDGRYVIEMPGAWDSPD